MNFLYVIVLFVATAKADVAKTQKCRDMPTEKIDYQKLSQFNPLIFYRSTEVMYNCSQAVFIHSIGDKDCYTGQVVVLKSDTAIAYDVDLEDGSVFRATHCTSGMRGNYKVLLSRIDNKKNAYFCVGICDKDGDSIEVIACSGRTRKDEIAIDNYIRNELRVNISGQVYNSQENCIKTSHCIAF